MLFNSIPFAIFLPLALAGYWALHRKLHAQNLLLVALSYVFYGYWDWRFLSLLIVSSVLDYSIGLGLASTSAVRRRRLLLLCSLIGNLGLLGVFKYYGFFVRSLVILLDGLGIPLDFRTLNIVLPVGISFYTFQTMSYTIDVYRGKIEATRDFGAIAAYVAFFPQLVAGPIERAGHLLPQMLRARRVTPRDVEVGFWLILLGFVRKSVVADNIAFVVDRVFGGRHDYGAVTLLVGSTAFAVQIYCDFSGYSNIARGVSKLFGFDLMVNFKAPYASLSVQEFWRRWHISLSSWLRDYLYVPLGGNRNGSLQTYRNLMLTMLLGGLWHGASWNFVAWGAWQGLGLAFHRALFRERSLDVNLRGVRRTAVRAFSWLVTMAFVLQGWVLFRVHGLHGVLDASRQWLDWSRPLLLSTGQVVGVAAACLCVFGLDRLESRNYEEPVLSEMGFAGRIAVAVLLMVAITLLGSFRSQPFLYFQF